MAADFHSGFTFWLLGSPGAQLRQSWGNTGLREEGRESSPPQGLPRLLLKKRQEGPKGQKRASPALLGKGVLEGQQLPAGQSPTPKEGRRPPASSGTPRP